MRDRDNPPDLDELSLALAAVFAVAGRSPDRSSPGDLVWRWVDQNNNGRGYALRLDFWWFPNEYKFPVDSWTLSIGRPSPKIAGPDLADVLQKLQDPEIRRRFLVVEQ